MDKFEGSFHVTGQSAIASRSRPGPAWLVLGLGSWPKEVPHVVDVLRYVEQYIVILFRIVVDGIA